MERRDPNLSHYPTTKYKIMNIRTLAINGYMTSCAPIIDKSKKIVHMKSCNDSWLRFFFMLIILDLRIFFICIFRG